MSGTEGVPAERHYCDEAIWASVLGMAGDECPHCGDTLQPMEAISA